MSDLVVASNRGPLSFEMDSHGQPVAVASGGGLAGTLHPLLAGSGATWVTASMNDADRSAADHGLVRESGLHLVMLDIDEQVYRMAYDVVSNATLWFCHHHLFDLPRRPRFDRRWSGAWEAYRHLNMQFAEAIAAESPRGATVLVQDYHLSLVGSHLSKARPDLHTVHFSHTPFADPSVLRCLPEDTAAELLTSMAGFGACGFHAARWESAFRAAYDDEELSRRSGGARPPRTFVSALAPSVDALMEEARGADVAVARQELEERLGGRKLILRVDRIELSKNLVRGFLAYEELLETRPEWRGTVVMVALAYPSRQALADYLAYRSEVEHAAARINEAWGDEDWNPIVLDVADNRARSVAALTSYDVLLVNPIRDGMNLVAKEGPLLNSKNGVVVLSREAGAWDELSRAVLGINPFDISDTARALDVALGMPTAERAELASALRRIVAGRTAKDWLDDQLRAGRPEH